MYIFTQSNGCTIELSFESVSKYLEYGLTLPELGLATSNLIIPF